MRPWPPRSGITRAWPRSSSSGRNQPTLIRPHLVADPGEGTPNGGYGEKPFANAVRAATLGRASSTFLRTIRVGFRCSGGGGLVAHRPLVLVWCALRPDFDRVGGERHHDRISIRVLRSNP